jgi:hypothetical protein
MQEKVDKKQRSMEENRNKEGDKDIARNKGKKEINYNEKVEGKKERKRKNSRDRGQERNREREKQFKR